MKFKVEFFQALESLENDERYGKVWKIFEKYEVDLENMCFCFSLH